MCLLWCSVHLNSPFKCFKFSTKSFEQRILGCNVDYRNRKYNLAGEKFLEKLSQGLNLSINQKYDITQSLLSEQLMRYLPCNDHNIIDRRRKIRAIVFCIMTQTFPSDIPVPEKRQFHIETDSVGVA